MYRPLTDDEKRAAIRDGVTSTMAEAQRLEPELRQLRETAKRAFFALITAPTLTIEQAPLSEGAKPPTEPEGWTVTVAPKVVE